MHNSSSSEDCFVSMNIQTGACGRLFRIMCYKKRSVQHWRTKIRRFFNLVEILHFLCNGKSAKFKKRNLRSIILRCEYTHLKQNNADNSFPVLIHSNNDDLRDGAIHVIPFKEILRGLPRGSKQYNFKNETTKQDL